MKKIILVLMFGCLTTSLFAQTDNMKPVQGDIGFTVGFTGIAPFAYQSVNSWPAPSGVLLIHYYLTDQWSLRGQLNISTASNSSSFSDSISPYGTKEAGNWTTSSKSSSWNVGLGIQRSFAATKHLEPYLALDIFLGSGKALDTTDTWAGTGFWSGNTLSYTTSPGSMFTFGAGIVAGFNYFFSDHVAIGGEFSFGYSGTSVDNGTWTEVEGYPASPGVAAYTETQTGVYPGVSYHNFGPNVSGTITLSIFFPAKW